jgi:hypothetical protein
LVSTLPEIDDGFDPAAISTAEIATTTRINAATKYTERRTGFFEWGSVTPRCYESDGGNPCRASRTTTTCANIVCSGVGLTPPPRFKQMV